jgi:hypothetical protein
VASLTQDLAVTESQIPAAEAQAEVAAVVAQEAAQEATQLQTVANGESWFSKNRTLLTWLGLGAIGFGYWYYRKNKVAGQLPPPSSMKQPSGL